MFYAKQGLILFIGEIIIWLLSGIFGWLKYLLWIFFTILWAMAWINSLSGEEKNTLIIGNLAKKNKIIKLIVKLLDFTTRIIKLIHPNNFFQKLLNQFSFTILFSSSETTAPVDVLVSVDPRYLLMCLYQ